MIEANDTHSRHTVWAYEQDIIRIHFRNIGKHGRKAIAEKDDYVAKLVDAFMYGDEIVRSQPGRKDVCTNFKAKCASNSKKPAY